MKSNLISEEALTSKDFSKYTIGVVQSKYHSHITDELLNGATEVLKSNKVGKVYLLETPGAFELIYGTTKLVYDELLELDGIVVLGCVIKGDTDHDIYINQAVTDAIANIIKETLIPVGLGLLTVNTEIQAMERAGGIHGNKGKEAALAVLHSLTSELKEL